MTSSPALRQRFGSGNGTMKGLNLDNQDVAKLAVSAEPQSVVGKHAIGKLDDSRLLLFHELVNINSHLFGGLLFFVLPFIYYISDTKRVALVQRADLIVFSTFFFGVSICYFLSSIYHTFNNHSPTVCARGLQCDFLGIVILMWGATIPSVYYGFHCDLTLQRTYWTVVSVLATLCAVTTLHPKFRHPSLRVYRSLMYTGLGLSSLVFIFHGIAKYGLERQQKRMSLSWMGYMAAANLSGALAYAARIPERWYPYRFDIWGSSHQTLHVMVIVAGLFHMVGLLKAFDYVRTMEPSCS